MPVDISLPATQLDLVPTQLKGPKYDGFVLKPQLLGHKPDLPAEFREVWSHELVCRPKKPVVIGHIDTSSILAGPYLQTSSFVIKEPHSDLVVLRGDLAPYLPFVQKAIDHEYAFDPGDARERRFRLLIDHSPHKIGEAHRDHAREWHTHSPRKERSRSLGVPVTRYVSLAAPSGTLFWTGAIEEGPIFDNIPDQRLIGKPVVGKTVLQATAGDIMTWTSAHVHRSATNQATAEQSRLFLILFSEHRLSDVEDEWDVRAKRVCYRPDNPLLAALKEAGAKRRQQYINRWARNAQRALAATKG